ncbi:MAG: tRNA (adenosine(37)-N6)-threonylcarbamoyltransferase complex ATPase subunit type 1 TsaE [Actinobacteria bacterium]|nr:tRNA (adenosine(37)-N6)-threonylcarbamoyltransferase complex ATPase subunit type 1 TsaE [Actinomycetota bacterium]
MSAHGSGAVGASTRAVLVDAEATRAFGRELATRLRAGDLVVLTGGLGAGKTTLTQGIGAGLQVRGPVVSPPFTIARVQPSLVDGPALVHVDAYRLSSLAEVDALDLDTSLEESVTVVEWGAGWVEPLAGDRLEVQVERPRGRVDETGTDAVDAASGARVVTLTGIGGRWAGVELPGEPVEG